MLNLTHRAVVLVNQDAISVAQRVAKAFDSDVGGEYSFSRTTQDGFHVCDTPITNLYADLFLVMLYTPGLLYQMCAADYADRWPDLPCPTEEECAFLVLNSHVVVEPQGRTTREVLSELGTSLYEEVTT